ncbi:MAG: PP2C family protein-serine/threonine phosphatase [Acidobacteriaceae bacterium]|nr:PP2C family protein-serine/threonine phosphatase [Acidobacteriaceae bacterium]
MRLPKYSQWTFRLVLGIGALVAFVLCIQCVRTYLYADAVLVPAAAETEAARQAAAVNASARAAGIADPHNLAPVLQHAIEAAPDRLLWMRILDLNANVFAQAGTPQGKPNFPPHWWDRVEKHQRLGKVVDTTEGKAWLVMLPFRLAYSRESANPPLHPSDHRRTSYVIELAIPLEAVSGAFAGLRENLILGVVASLALLLSVAVIGFRAPQYFRGKYLESELQLARRVQTDLHPKPDAVSLAVDFAASFISADHVGGDFYDIFETESGQIAIVLGDVSGKGIPAALLVSVLVGAIRSSLAFRHESACERINRMLCERTACERFATLFWAVYDPPSRTLRYVNAGHAPPLVFRRTRSQIERLDQGGPVLGFLREARYSAGIISIDEGDSLILYSDGISEAASQNDEEFGEDRIKDMIVKTAGHSPAQICTRLMKEVTAFAHEQSQPDDRTLLVVKFQQPEVAQSHHTRKEIEMATVA